MKECVCASVFAHKYVDELNRIFKKRNIEYKYQAKVGKGDKSYSCVIVKQRGERTYNLTRSFTEWLLRKEKKTKSYIYEYYGDEAIIYIPEMKCYVKNKILYNIMKDFCEKNKFKSIIKCWNGALDEKKKD